MGDRQLTALGEWSMPAGKTWIVVGTGVRPDLYDDPGPDLVVRRRPPTRRELPEIRRLRLRTDGRDPPGWLRALPRLEALTLPTQMLPQLRAEHLPASVRCLSATNELDPASWKNDRATFAADAVFPQITSLSGNLYCYRCPTRYVFDAATFPSLRNLDLTLAPGPRMRDVVRSLGLVRLSISGFRDLHEVVDLVGPNLRSLVLCGSPKIAQLGEVARLRHVEHLNLVGFSSIRTLHPLEALKKLRSFGLFYARRVDDVSALLRLPRLKSVMEFGAAPNPHLRTLRPALKKRGISVWPPRV